MMRKQLNGAAALTLALLMPVVSTTAFAQMPKPDFRGQSPRESQGLIESLRAAGHFTKLLVILDRAGLTDTLSNSTKGLTLFAPDDAAFALLPAVMVEKLTADPARARAFILPYLLNGKHASKELIQPAPRARLKTFAGTSLQVSNKGSDAGLLVIFDAAQTGVGGLPTGWPCCGRVTSGDHLTANGVYHEITFASASGGVWR
jgi:uncharacterized surface protein with fasciclin (FAS1) repeats